MNIFEKAPLEIRAKQVFAVEFIDYFDGFRGGIYHTE
jgi:hypothetical protein